MIAANLAEFRQRQLVVCRVRRQLFRVRVSRRRSGNRGRTIVLYPRLVGKPEQDAKSGPHQQSLIVHALLFLPAPGAASSPTSSPVTGQAVKQLPSRGVRRRRLVHHDDVETLQFGLMLSE